MLIRLAYAACTAAVMGVIRAMSQMKPRQLTRNCHHGNVAVLAARGEFAVTLAQTQLGIPGAVDDRLRQPVVSFLDGRTDLGGVTVRPRCFDQQTPRVAVARLGDAAQLAVLPGRVFGWCDAEPRHQLARMIEPGQIAEFSHQADRGGELDAAQRLQGFNDRVETPLRRRFTQRRLQPRALSQPVFNRAAMLLEGDLLPRQIERIAADPASAWRTGSI